MNWQKITIWTLILSVIIYLTFYYIGNNIDKFCYPGHFDCLEKLKFGLAFSFVALFKYIILCLSVISLLPIRYKKSLYIGFIVVSTIVFIFVFNMPDSCGSFMCFDKISGAVFARNLYPLVLIPILVINFFRFRRQDKKLLLNK